MVYVDRENLTIIELIEEKEELSFEEIIFVLRNKPSNVIYIEVSDILIGIVTMGDVKRAKEAGQFTVKVNRDFTKFTIDEYMSVRENIKNNSRINAIPIVNETGNLLGHYMRWDDDLYLKRVSEVMKSRHALKYLEKHPCVVFVRPTKENLFKQEILSIWKNILLDNGCRVNIIEHEKIIECERNEEIIFIDEDECRGIGTLYTHLLGFKYDWSKVYTLKSFLQPIWKFNINCVAKTIFEELKRQGVTVLLVGFRENANGYLKKFNSMVENKFSSINYENRIEVTKDRKEKFFEDIYDERYMSETFPLGFSVRTSNGVPELEDVSSQLMNVFAGERVTIGQPDDYTRCIYMYGACNIWGAYVEDKHTIASRLQNKFNNEGLKWKVINKGIAFPIFCYPELIKCTNENYKRGDIVIIDCFEQYRIENVPYINFVDIFEKYSVSPEWVTDAVRHSNYKVAELCADAIYEKLLTKKEVDEELGKNVENINEFIDENYISKYFTDYFMMGRFEKVGSIVMNCNPFTKGHRYLIEQAYNQVDFLIIFVVEEEQSLFSFEERFAMVSNGVADLERALVVPSGDFILSRRSFPDYFLKVAGNRIALDTANDVLVFATVIAPRLNITHRFVGEELHDPVTNEYNEAMKRILPSYGIDVIEIPRKEWNGTVVSASSVRKYLLEHNQSSVNGLVPNTTRQIIYRKLE